MNVALKRNGTFWQSELPGEHGFEYSSALHSIQVYFPYATILACIYVPLMYGLKQVMNGTNQRFDLLRPLILWNLGLAIFSWMGAIRMMPELIMGFLQNGTYHAVCTTWGKSNSIVNFWTYYFVVSKVFELGDTLFIVLRRRPLIFLHVYHHFTVLLMSWYLCANEVTVGYWFTAINYSVHSMMYTYYALRAMRVQVPLFISVFITSVQSFQMVVGLGILSYSTYTKYNGYFCSISGTECIIAAVIYFTYFILFAEFFYCSYVSSRTKIRINVKKLK